MKVPGIPAEAIQSAVQATVARPAPVIPTAAASETALPVVPVNPAEPAAALRILLEEIRLAVVAELGTLRARLPAPAPGEGPAEAAERATRFLRAALTEAAAAGRRIPQGVVETLVTAASERTLTVTARPPAGAAPGTAIAVEEARQEIFRALPAKPGARLAAAPATVPRLFVEQVRAAIEERLGMLPGAAAATIGEPDTPAEALTAVARLFRAAVDDPVIAVRASNLSLSQALELGAGRALSLTATGAQPEEGSVLVADLRALASRQLVAGVAQSLPEAARPPTDLPGAVQLLQSELRHTLLERVVSQPPVATAPATVEPRSLAASLVTTLALAAQSWPVGDARAARTSAEAVLDIALRRTLLQLPVAIAGRAQLVASIMDVQVEALRLMAAAESVAPRGVGWTRPALEASTALLRGQEPPFRLDLAPDRRVARSGRGRRRPEGEGEVDAIESSDPEERERALRGERRPPD